MRVGVVCFREGKRWEMAVDFFWGVGPLRLSWNSLVGGRTGGGGADAPGWTAIRVTQETMEERIFEVLRQNTIPRQTSSHP